ncbi:MAG: endonuclease domain-containing protein [Ignavibacteria bacterium]|nr:endonuclease domain-containing protein [Ignavibacteria bacterium]
MRKNQLHNIDKLRDRRKELRSNLTPAEAFLWKYLKNSQLEGRKFRRQHSFGKFVIDFYCSTQKLGVELDGMYHFTEEQIKYDAERSEYMNSLGIRIIRFENAEVFEKTDEVLIKIKDCFRSNHPVTS